MSSARSQHVCNTGLPVAWHKSPKDRMGEYFFLYPTAINIEVSFLQFSTVGLPCRKRLVLNSKDVFVFNSFCFNNIEV